MFIFSMVNIDSEYSSKKLFIFSGILFAGMRKPSIFALRFRNGTGVLFKIAKGKVLTGDVVCVSNDNEEQDF